MPKRTSHPGGCTGFREGNFPFDDLDRRSQAITKLAWDVTDHVFRPSGQRLEIPWWRGSDNLWVASVLVKTEKADALVEAAQALKLTAEAEEEVQEFQYFPHSKLQGPIYAVRMVRIALPPLWTSCGCLRCVPIGGKSLFTEPCHCAELGCWCTVDGHPSKHGG